MTSQDIFILDKHATVADPESFLTGCGTVRNFFLWQVWNAKTFICNRKKWTFFFGKGCGHTLFAPGVLIDPFEAPYCHLGDFMQALQNFEKYRQTGNDYYELRTDANLQLARFYMKLSEHRTDNEALQYIIKAYEASVQSKI